MSQKKLTGLNLKKFQDPAESNRLNIWADRVRGAVDTLDERVTTLEEAESGAAIVPDLAGDVTGASDANTVEAIQGIPVSTTDPTNGQVLTYDGSEWEPATPPTYTSWSPVLWRWNRTNTSQFNTTPIITSAIAPPPDNSAALTLHADATTELGPMLKIAGTWIDGGAAVFELNSGEFTLPASGRCVVQYRIAYVDVDCNVGVFFHDGGGSDIYGFGWAHYEQTTNALRILRAEGTSVPVPAAGWRPFVLPAGTPAMTGVTNEQDPGGNPPPPYFGTVYQAELLVKQGSAGVPPAPFVAIRCLSGSNANGVRPRDGLITDNGVAYAVETGWQNKTINKFGLCVVSVASAAYEAYITDLQILVHPLDYPA